jgi:curved DNA-binding protein CbpA
MAFVRKETHYELLGLERDASMLQIQSQFETLVLFWQKIYSHSPREAELKLIEIQAAFEILSNPVDRQSYDETLDFEFVLLDGKTKDEEMEEAYDVYRHNHKKSYQEIYAEFNKFKNELGSTLWMLKSTTLYLIVTLFLYSGIALIFTILSERFEQINMNMIKYKHMVIPIYLLISGVSLYFFRKYYQLPYLKKRKTISSIEN